MQSSQPSRMSSEGPIAKAVVKGRAADFRSGGTTSPPMFGGNDEKAAVRETIALETSFRTEKQQIVASMGFSPALLLTPLADDPVKRKLQSFDKSFNSGRLNVNSVAPMILDPLGESCGNLSMVEQHVSSRRITRSEDPALWHQDNIERTMVPDYVEDQAFFWDRVKQGRRMFVIIWCVVLLLVVSITLPIVLSQSKEDGIAASDGQCTPDTSNPCVVPDCAKLNYEALKTRFQLEDSDFVTDNCDAVHFAATSLAIRKTDSSNWNQDEMYENMFFALATFYFSMGGEKWYNDQDWMTSAPPCAWHGINCTIPDEVSDIVLVGNHLAGSIPSQISLLTSLSRLSIANNALEASTLPSEIGLLLNLESLDLMATRLIGQLPSEIGLCTRLTTIDLRRTDLTGTIPSEIGNLANLGKDFLWCWETYKLTASSALTNLWNPESLQLEISLTTGPLPSELGMLAILQTLSLSNFLVEFDIKIPSEVTHLSHLKHIDIEAIATSQSWLDKALKSLTSLTLLSLSNPPNDMTPSKLPTEIGMLTLLEHLFLNQLSMEGSIPTEMAQLSHLKTLSMFVNEISGTIPTEIGRLSNLTTLDLSENRLTGTVPREIGELTNIKVLSLLHNELSMPIPSEVCALVANDVEIVNVFQRSQHHINVLEIGCD